MSAAGGHEDALATLMALVPDLTEELALEFLAAADFNVEVAAARALETVGAAGSAEAG